MEFTHEYEIITAYSYHKHNIHITNYYWHDRTTNNNNNNNQKDNRSKQMF